MEPRPYWIVGPGRLGLAIGSLLSAAAAADRLFIVGRGSTAPDHPVFDLPHASYTSDPDAAPGSRTAVLLTVPDGKLPQVVERLAGLGSAGTGCVALHFSGALESAVLAPLTARGYAVGSLHPLQTVADPREGARRLEGSFFTYEGEPGARDVAAAIVAAVRGSLLEVSPSEKARYHAACVFASNYIVTCASMAVRLLAEAVNVSPEEAARALQPLWRGAISNLDQVGLPGALTGPIARGDVETVRRHLAGLDSEARVLYRSLARETVRLSREQGLPAEEAAAIEAELGDLAGAPERP
jgi:predicted short-subunit dehydrogenase-like oxidoreductase (DUF2520 family)